MIEIKKDQVWRPKSRILGDKVIVLSIQGDTVEYIQYFYDRDLVRKRMTIERFERAIENHGFTLCIIDTLKRQIK